MKNSEITVFYDKSFTRKLLRKTARYLNLKYEQSTIKKQYGKSKVQ